MNSINPRSVGASTGDLSDLDGFSVSGDYSFPMQNQFNSNSTNDFGFDPPTHDSNFPKLETYSPPEQLDPLQLNSWPGFDNNNKGLVQPSKLSALPNNGLQPYELDRMLNQNLPNPSNAVARFGQVTPPRSNSASSEDQTKSAGAPSPTTTGPERRKRNTKTNSVDDSATAAAAPTAGRKRKNTRKSSVVTEEQDDKRRQSLEKNRLAAAKCRVNKKEKTEQLQRDSHDKAVHNAFLKDQVMRMKEEVQQMNALLLAHAHCEGCKSPEEIQKHLSDLGNEFFANHMSSLNYGDYSQLNMHDDVSQMGHDSTMQQDYFARSPTDHSLMNPPLPEFDRAAEFEVHTPMQTD